MLPYYIHIPLIHLTPPPEHVNIKDIPLGIEQNGFLGISISVINPYKFSTTNVSLLVEF
jgi:hypothetical protein